MDFATPSTMYGSRYTMLLISYCQIRISPTNRIKIRSFNRPFNQDNNELNGIRSP